MKNWGGACLLTGNSHFPPTPPPSPPPPPAKQQLSQRLTKCLQRRNCPYFPEKEESFAHHAKKTLAPCPDGGIFFLLVALINLWASVRGMIMWPKKNPGVHREKGDSACSVSIFLSDEALFLGEKLWAWLEGISFFGSAGKCSIRSYQYVCFNFYFLSIFFLVSVLDIYASNMFVASLGTSGTETEIIKSHYTILICNMNIPCTGKRNTMIRQYFSLDRLLRAENPQLANQKIDLIYHSRVRGPSISLFSLLRSAHIFPHNVVLFDAAKNGPLTKCVLSLLLSLFPYLYSFSGRKAVYFSSKAAGCRCESTHKHRPSNNNDSTRLSSCQRGKEGISGLYRPACVFPKNSASFFIMTHRRLAQTNILSSPENPLPAAKKKYQ